MKQHLYTYGASLAIHATAFLLVALIATHRHVVPPIEIDFTVSAAHASSQQAAPPAPPSPTRKPPTPAQPDTVPPPQPPPQPSLQAVSDVAVEQPPHEPTPPVPQPVVAASAQPRQQTTGQAPASAAAGGDSKGAIEQARARYVKEQFVYIRDKIASHVRYPRQAQRMGWSGAVQVSFIIEENGNVSDIRIVRNSKHNILDEEAVDSVKRSAPFPRPPVRARIIIPVEFELS